MRVTVNSPEQLGQATRILRENRRLTQRELARESATSQRWLSELERGKNVVALERTFDILARLGARVTVEWDGASEHPVATALLESVDASSNLEGRIVPAGIEASAEVRNLLAELLAR